MWRRFFIKTVNAGTTDEHYIIVDTHHDNACFQVFFDLGTAKQQAIALNGSHQWESSAPVHHQT